MNMLRSSGHIFIFLISHTNSINLASLDETSAQTYKLCKSTEPTVLRETSSGTISVSTPESTRYINCTWVLNPVDYQRDLNFYFTKLSTEKNPEQCIDSVKLIHNGIVVKEACGEELPIDMSEGREFVITQKAKSDPIMINFETDEYPNLMGFEGFELRFQEKKSKLIFDTRTGKEDLGEHNSSTVAILVIGIIALLLVAVLLFIKFRGADRSLNIFKSRVNELDDTYPNIDMSNINSSRGFLQQSGGDINASRNITISSPINSTAGNNQNIQDGVYGGPIVRQSTEQTDILQTIPLVHAYGDGEEVMLESENAPRNNLPTISSQSTIAKSISPTEVSQSTALSPSTIVENLERSRMGTLPADTEINSDYASFSRPLPEIPDDDAKSENRTEVNEPENDYVTQEEIEHQRSTTIQTAKYGYPEDN